MFGLFKRKEITINNKQELVATLTKLIELLCDSGFDAQANAVRKPLEYLYQDDTINFLKFLKTVDIWGGSGAAWEVYPFNTTQRHREFQSCFIHLAQLLKDTGIKFRSANQIANVFKEDLLQDE